MVISILGDVGAENGTRESRNGRKRKNKQTTKNYSRRRKVVIDLSPPTVFFSPGSDFPLPYFLPQGSK